MTDPSTPVGTPVAIISDVREVARIFRTRRVTIGVTTLAVAILVTFWTLRQPRIYSATVTVEYDPDPPRPLGSNVEDPGSPAAGYLASQEWYETQNKILSSTLLAERVAKELQLHRNREFMDVSPDAPLNASVADAGKLLKNRLIVKGVKDTRLVEISVEDVDRDRAALIANTLADIYIERSLEDRLGSTQRALEWLSSQLDSTTRRLQGAEDELQSYKRTHDVLSVSFEDRQNIIATEIERFNLRLIDARSRRMELTVKMDQLNAAQRDNPFDVHAPEIDGSVDVARIRADVRELYLQRESLMPAYGPAHPTMKALENKLLLAEANLKRVIQGILTSHASELAAAKSLETALSSALASANAAGHRLNQEEIGYRRLDRERKNEEGLLELLLKRSAETDLARALKMSYARIADPASAPDAPLRPRVPLNILSGIAFGLFLGISIAFVSHRLDSSVRGVDEAESMGLPVLGIIPSITSAEGVSLKRPAARNRRGDPGVQTRDLIVHNSPRSSVAECCRTVRTNLGFTMAGSSVRSIVVTSPSPREGKSTIAVSLAITLAQSGKQVLLVDTDLRKPRLHRALSLPGATGVTSILVGDMTLAQAVRETVVPNLSFLAAGAIPPNPAELLHSAAFRTIVSDAEKMFDLVVFDSPPLTAVVDAAIVGTLVGGVVVVAHSKRTTRHALASLLRQLKDVNARLLGGVINDVDPRGTGYGYAYGGRYYYHSGTYYGDPDDQPPQPPSEQSSAREHV